MSANKYLLSLGVLALSLNACFDSKPKTERQMETYAIGIKLAKSYKETGVILDPEMLRQAVLDFNRSEKIQISDEELLKWDYYTLQKISSGKKVNANERLKTTKIDIEEYMKEEGVQKDGSGLLVKELNPGNGPKVTENKRVVVHYTGRLMDGKIFDSSVMRGQPAEFGLNNIIPGLRLALLQMRVGQKMEVVIPPELGYGASGSGSIPANSALKFELEVIKVK